MKNLAPTWLYGPNLIGERGDIEHVSIMEEAKVPCGECRKCCRDFQAVPVLDKDKDRYPYKTEQIGGIPILKRKANGDCFYLEESGCTIHEHRPATCRVFDCRKVYDLWSRGLCDVVPVNDDGRIATELLLEGARRVHTLR